VSLVWFNSHILIENSSRISVVVLGLSSCCETHKVNRTNLYTDSTYIKTHYILVYTQYLSIL